MNAPVLLNRSSTERFTFDQIMALVEKGLLYEGRGFELIDGEITSVSPKGPLHENVSLQVMRWLRRLPPRLDIMPETTLYLDEINFREPDYVVFDNGVQIADLKPSDVTLAIEVADDSWSYDTGDKALRYAKHGVGEYWVIHDAKRIVRVHRLPGAEGWASIEDVQPGASVAPLCAPDMPFRLEKP